MMIVVGDQWAAIAAIRVPQKIDSWSSPTGRWSRQVATVIPHRRRGGRRKDALFVQSEACGRGTACEAKSNCGRGGKGKCHHAAPERSRERGHAATMLAPGSCVTPVRPAGRAGSRTHASSRSIRARVAQRRLVVRASADPDRTGAGSDGRGSASWSLGGLLSGAVLVSVLKLRRRTSAAGGCESMHLMMCDTCAVPPSARRASASETALAPGGL